MKSIYAWFRHNRGIVISCVLASGILFWVYACQSRVRSIVKPDIIVTRHELNAEVEHFLRQAELKFQDLDRQDEFKKLLFETAINFAEGKTVSPIAVLITLGNILGIGAIIDNQRKDVHIKTLKNNAKS